MKFFYADALEHRRHLKLSALFDLCFPSPCLPGALPADADGLWLAADENDELTGWPLPVPTGLPSLFSKRIFIPGKESLSFIQLTAGRGFFPLCWQMPAKRGTVPERMTFSFPSVPRRHSGYRFSTPLKPKKPLMNT